MLFFKLFFCCKITRGVCRSIIIDTQRGTNETIPNDLVDFLEKFEGTSLDNILNLFDIENRNTLQGYFDFLINSEYGFWCDSLEEFFNFPEIENKWESPYQITNAILDVGNDPKIDYFDIIEDIKKIAIPHVQIRSAIIRDFSFYEKLINSIETSRISSVELIIPYTHDEPPLNYLKKFIRRNLRINKIIFHSSPYVKKITIIENLSNICYTKDVFNSAKDCGKISLKNFVLNSDHYYESQDYNSCLNRKISIDINGEIKNCPSLKHSFGNIKEISLLEIIKTYDITKLWIIDKSKIEVCNDCEFRHICTDCRAFLKVENNILSQPLKCNYNPYIAKWKGEKGYLTVENWRKNNNHE